MLDPQNRGCKGRFQEVTGVSKVKLALDSSRWMHERVWVLHRFSPVPRGLITYSPPVYRRVGTTISPHLKFSSSPVHWA